MFLSWRPLPPSRFANSAHGSFDVSTSPLDLVDPQEMLKEELSDQVRVEEIDDEGDQDEVETYSRRQVSSEERRRAGKVRRRF